MRIYISSTYTDLVDHRSAVARVLRQMGHEVIGMEEYVAEGLRPLDRCLLDAANADLYVGIFAWRYGHVPKNAGGGAPTLPPGTKLGATSITEFEFRAAIPKKPLIFLLDDTATWPAQFIDAVGGENKHSIRVRALRAELRESWLTAFFTTPEDLARQVAAAVHRRELNDRINSLGSTLQASVADALMITGPIRDSALHSMKASLLAVANMKALRLDLKDGNYWWSTRLFFLARIAESITATQMFVFIEHGETFVGAATPATVRDRLARNSPLLRKFDQYCQNNPVGLHDLDLALDTRAKEWNNLFVKANTQETQVRTLVNKRDLRRWLGNDLIERGVEQEDEVPTARYLKTLLDWPHVVVPVTSAGKLKGIVDRAALAEYLANLFVRDLALQMRQDRV